MYSNVLAPASTEILLCIMRSCILRVGLDQLIIMQVDVNYKPRRRRELRKSQGVSASAVGCSRIN